MMTFKKPLYKQLLIALLAFSFLALTVIFTDSAIENQPELELEPESVILPRVTTTAITAGRHQSHFQAYGEMLSNENLSLSSMVQGQVIWRNPAFNEGSRVKKGTVLIRLEQSNYLAILASAQHELANAQQALQEEKFKGRQAIDDWQRSNLPEQPGDLVLRKPQLLAAKARLNSAKSNIEKAQYELQQTHIRAPFDAIINKRQVALGSFVSQGSAIAQLSASSKGEISLSLSAKQWQLLDPNMNNANVKLTSSDHPDSVWFAQIIRLADNIDQQTRLRKAIIQIAQPLTQTPPLIYGSFVKAEVEGRFIDDVFSAPVSALSADGYIWYVLNNQLQRHKSTPIFMFDGRLYFNRDELPTTLDLVIKPLASYLPGLQVNSIQIAGAL